MKKRYKKSKYRLRQWRLAKKQLYRLKKNRKKVVLNTYAEYVKNRQNNNFRSSFKALYERKHNRYVLKCPRYFSIAKNPEIMSSFFADVTSLAKKGKRIFLNMDNVGEVNMDSVLYLISLFRYCDHVFGLKTWGQAQKSDIFLSWRQTFVVGVC